MIKLGPPPVHMLNPLDARPACKLRPSSSDGATRKLEDVTCPHCKSSVAFKLLERWQQEFSPHAFRCVVELLELLGLDQQGGGR